MSRKTVGIMLDWIEENLENDAALEAMARHVGYSAFYCSSKFHQYTGLSFKAYLLGRRLDTAACRLLTSQANILDIALRYGFSSQEAFTRAFRKAHGLPPGQFRLQKPIYSPFERLRLD